MKLNRGTFQVIVFITIFAMMFSSVQSPSVHAQSGDGIKRKFNTESGKISFIGPESGRVLRAANALGTYLRPQNPAMALVKQFGPEFGLKNAEAELSETKTGRSDDGRITAHYQQNYNGIPVMGGELVVNTNNNGDLYSINGEVSPNLSLPIKPIIAPEQAAETALLALAKWYEKTPADFQVSKPELWIFDESLLRPSTKPVELVWRMEVIAKGNAVLVRELVLVNAMIGNISLHFNQIDTEWKASAINITPNNHQVHTPTFQATNAALATCAIENGSASTSLFRPYKRYNCGLYSYGVGTGDFNNDGKQDVALSTRTGTGYQHEILIFSQDNTGNLSQPVSYTAGLRSEYLAVGDLNHDGRDDVVTADFLDNTISVYLQNASGSLVSRVTYVTSTGPDSIAVDDINNDGLDDVVVSHWNSATIGVFTQKAVGTLNSMVTYSSVAAGYDDLAIGDVNNDGLNDVVKMNGQGLSSNIMVYLQNSNGGLNPYTSYSLSNCSSFCTGNGLGIGDVTGDGREDVIMSYGGNGDYAKIAIFPQSQNGTLLASIPYASKDIPDPVEIADINSDNLLDVIVLHSGWQSAGIYQQQSNGTLSAESLYSMPYKSWYYSQDLAIDDVNNDGLPDILVADGQGLVVLYHALLPAENSKIRTYSANHSGTLPGDFLCDDTVIDCTGGINPDADHAQNFAIGTYQLYSDRYERNSIDNNGMVIISSVQYCDPYYPCPYANAAWTGEQMVYGDAYGFAYADDVVAHELTHGVTQKESNLLYYYQSGAINESFSDLWGEYYDQINGQGNDGTDVKWRLGEDVTDWKNGPLYPELGIRDMKDPTLFYDPDKMSSPYYYEGESDYGGVHWNSGVNNKAVYLMVDGDTFNDKPVTAIGWTKTGAIYYEAQTNLLTSGSDYSDLYYALQQACINLTGQNGITSNDCAQVQNAIDAVEMNSQPVPDFNADAPMCPDDEVVSNIVFADDLEEGTFNWDFDNGTYPRWQYDTPLPFGPYAQSGDHSLFADGREIAITDATAQLTPFVVPPYAYLHFAHAYDFETGSYYYDGGVLEYSTNGDSNWLDAGSLIEYNLYDGNIYNGWNNPLKNRPAFVGTSHGYISSRVNLASLAGQTITLRWRMGLDSVGSSLGWWLDNIKVYQCRTYNPPTDITLSHNNIDENMPTYSEVGNLSTTDPDLGETFTYSFCGGNDDASFQINGFTLESAEVFDYETKSSYSICVRSTDSTDLSTTELFTININNIDENAPSLLNYTGSTTNYQPPAYVSRYRFVNVNLSLLVDPSGQVQLGVSESITLKLFDDTSFTATVQQVHQEGTNVHSWVGSLDGTEIGHVIMTVSDGIFTAQVNTGDEVYQVNFLENGLYLATQVNQSAFPEDQVLPVPNVSPSK